MKKSFFFAFCLSYFLTSASAFADLDTLWVRKQHTAQITDLWFSPKSDTLKSVAADGQVITWRAATGDVLQKWQLPEDIDGGVFSPNGKLLATGKGGYVKLWDLERDTLINTYFGGDMGANGVRFSPDGKMLAVSGYFWSPKMRLLTVPDFQETKKMNFDGYNLQFSPDGHIAAQQAGNTGVFVIDTATQLPQYYPNGTSIPCYSLDGRYLAMYYPNVTEQLVEIYDAKTGAFLKSISHPIGISSITFSPNGKFVLFGSIAVPGPYEICSINNIETGQQISSFGHGADLLAVSPDSTFITAVGYSTLRLFRANWTLSSVNDADRIGIQNDLYPFAPNPIRDNVCTIRFHLSNTNTYPVNIIITDTLGRSIAVVQNQNYQSGEQAITFDISSLANGVYTCTMQIDGHSYSQSFTITR